MKEINYPEINVDNLMAEIRAAVVARGIDIEATSEEPITHVAVKLAASGPAKQGRPFELPRLTLSPEFQISDSGHYHVNDFLVYHDAEFLRNAYRAIFRRDPDERGLESNLLALRSGHFNKIDVLHALLNSPEGQKQRITIDGLSKPAAMQRAGRLPVVGYLVRWGTALLRLPKLVRRQTEIETTAMGQLQSVAAHINQLAARTTDMHARQLQELRLQRALIDKSIARAASINFGDADERVREVEDSLELLTQRVKQLSQILQQTRQELSPASSEARSRTSSATERHEWDQLYASFEDQFRGDADEVTARLKFYLPFIERSGFKNDMLDLGSGNGDWLALLKSEGYAARGVEMNTALLRRARERRLDVTEAEMTAYLDGLPDQSLNVISAFHVFEHVPFEITFHLLREIRRVLRPGGLIMMETPSPENLVVAACNFYSDPTHQKPLYPHTLTFMLNNLGFANVQLQFIHPADGSPFDDPKLEPLHMWFYGPRDYAIIAEKPPARG